MNVKYLEPTDSGNPCDACGGVATVMCDITMSALIDGVSYNKYNRIDIKICLCTKHLRFSSQLAILDNTKLGH